MLGDRIRKARMEAGLTQAEVAGKELSQAFVSLAERGKVHPSVETLTIIAERLQKPLAYFMEDKAYGKAIDKLLVQAASGSDDSPESLLKKAIDASAGIEDWSRFVRGTMRLAHVLHRKGELDQAIDQYLMALEAPELDAEDRLVCLWQLGLCYYEQCDFANALRWFQRGLQVADDQMTTAQRWSFTFWLNIGNTCYSLGTYARAAEAFQSAEAAASDPISRTYATMGLGLAFREQGLLLPAISKLDSCIGTFEAEGQFGYAMACRQNLAMVLVDSGDVLEAERLLEICLAYFRRSGEVRFEAHTLEELARIGYRRRDFAAVIANCDRALSLVDSQDYMIRGRLYRLKGQSLAASHMTEAGDHWLTLSIEIFRMVGAVSEMALSQKAMDDHK